MAGWAIVSAVGIGMAAVAYAGSNAATLDNFFTDPAATQTLGTPSMCFTMLLFSRH
jgi:hypothetical protein